jgi:hypothetical protein
VINGPIDRDPFTACVEQVLMPTLRPGEIITLDNLDSHEGPAPATPSVRLARTSCSCRPSART